MADYSANRCPECGARVYVSAIFDDFVTVNAGTEHAREECEECHDKRLEDGRECHCEACNALIDSKYLIQGAEELLCPVCHSSICIIE